MIDCTELDEQGLIVERSRNMEEISTKRRIYIGNEGAILDEDGPFHKIGMSEGTLIKRKNDYNKLSDIETSDCTDFEDDSEIEISYTDFEDSSETDALDSDIDDIYTGNQYLDSSDDDLYNMFCESTLMPQQSTPNGHSVRCPLPGCGRVVRNLPRHIRSSRLHGNDPEYVGKSTYIRNIFPDQIKKKSKYKRVKCDYCGSYQTRLSAHQIKCKLKNKYDSGIGLVAGKDEESNVSDIDLALQKFEEDLKGPDFQLSDDQAKSAKNMLKKFLLVGKLKKISDLLEEDKLRNAYSELLKGSLKASSRNNYLRIIKDYLDTIVIVQCKHQDTVSRLKILLDRWIKNSKGDIRKDKYAHKIKSQVNLISPEDMVAFESSDSVAHVKYYLNNSMNENMPQNRELNESDIIDSRAYISIRISIENGQRAGSISHMTIKEFDQRQVEENGSARITVFHHKTCETHGPSILSLSPDLHNYLAQYVNHVRPLLATSDVKEGHVFLSASGSNMTSSQLSNAAKLFWKRATKTHKMFNFTIVRKSVTTAVRQFTKNDTNTAIILANQMTHDKSTADKHYHLTRNSPDEQRQIHSTICESMGIEVCVF